MKKIIFLTVMMLAAGLGTAHAGFRIAPFVSYGLDFTAVSIPGVATATNTGGGLGGGAKLGYGWELWDTGLELDLGVLSGYQPLAGSKAEVLGIVTENSSYSIPVMAYLQAQFGAPYFIGGIGLDNVTSTSTATTPVASTTVTESSSSLGLFFGAGYGIPVGSSRIEIQGIYHIVMTEDTSDNLATVSLGYNFGL